MEKNFFMSIWDFREDSRLLRSAPKISDLRNRRSDDGASPAEAVLRLSLPFAAISKEMLIDVVFHMCLERSLAKGKIIRIFNTLEQAGMD